MKLKAFIATTLICGGFFVRPSTAQTNQLGPAYVSAGLGEFVTSQIGFTDNYNSRTGFVFSGGAGLLLPNRLCLCANATYFSMNGTAWEYDYGPVHPNQVPVLISKTSDGWTKFTQWIVNLGFRREFLLSKVYSLGLGLGGTYINFSKTMQSKAGSYDESGQRVFGIYGGLSGERRLEGTPHCDLC